jgi:hypothetical protein
MKTRALAWAPIALTFLVGCTVEIEGSDAVDNPPAETPPPSNPPVVTPPPASTCSLVASVPDSGDLLALKANQCNVPGSQGARKWYRLSATLPGTTDVVQLELWDNLGPFVGGVVRADTFTITGADANPATCGVCVRALGDKGATTTTQEFFATGGTVQVTQVGGNGQPIAATLSNITFAQLDPTTKAPVSGGCSSSLVRVQVSGTVVAVGGGGNGGNCPAIIGD